MLIEPSCHPKDLWDEVLQSLQTSIQLLARLSGESGEGGAEWLKSGMRCDSIFTVRPTLELLSTEVFPRADPFKLSRAAAPQACEPTRDGPIEVQIR